MEWYRGWKLQRAKTGIKVDTNMLRLKVLKKLFLYKQVYVKESTREGHVTARQLSKQSTITPQSDYLALYPFRKRGRPGPAHTARTRHTLSYEARAPSQSHDELSGADSLFQFINSFLKVL